MLSLLLALFLLGDPAPAHGARITNDCLSCHDGTMAHEIRFGRHHTGVSYELARTTGRANLRPSSSKSGLGRTIAADMLVDGRVQCASCHIDARFAGESSLRVSARNGRLCVTCHAVGVELVSQH